MRRIESSFRIDESKVREMKGTFMKSTSTTTALVVLIVSSTAVMQAAPKSRNDSPSTQARMILEDVAWLSTSVANTADKLALHARSPEQSDAQLDGLNYLKDDVNSIGRDLRMLEAEKASLTEWERKTLEEILPLMRNIAVNTEKAVETYSSSRNHMWATAFPQESAEIYEDAEHVKRILEHNLRLAKVREEEQHLEHEIGGN